MTITRKKFQVNSKKLLDLLIKAMKIIKPKSPIPMYSSGLLEVKDNKLSIKVTDMDHTLITHMEAEGDDCRLVLKIQDLFEIIKKITGKITFYEDRNKVTIENDTSKIELLLLEEEFFKVNMEHVTHITNVEVENFIQLFSFLPITNEEWSFIFQINNNYMEAIASDRKRLIFSQMPSGTMNSDHFPISFKTLNLLLKNVTGNLEIYQQQSQLIFKFSEGILWSKFAHIPPLNYNRILLKKQQGLMILVNRKVLLDGLNRVGLLASNISKVIKLIFKENLLTLYASDASRGQAEEIIPTESTVTGNLSMNCEFLINAIKTLDTQNIELYYTGHVSHFFICSHGGNNTVIHVVMPIVMSN
jgi:DNA polymerase-3 subunit beta